MPVVIETINLSKNYKGFQAVDQISLKVNKGEIYGFIGLNGAGKTTMIRMLLGMIRPSDGSSFLNGKRIQLNHYSIWEDVGYIVETPHAYPELTVRENLELIRRLRAIRDSHSVPTIMNKLNLTKYADKRAKDLSLGNSQRLGIAKALLHQPKILILDEPVNGLDPAGIVEVRELLRDLAHNHGVTIFISSHLLTEIAKIATKIGIIHDGKLQQELTTPELTQLLNRRLLINTLDNTKAMRTLLQEGYHANTSKEGLIEIRSQSAIDHPEDIAHTLVASGHSLTKLTIEEEDLESYFLRVIKGKGVDSYEPHSVSTSN